MILYWIGALVVLLVVFPIVVYLLRAVLDTARGIVPSVERIAAVAAAGSKDLDARQLRRLAQRDPRRRVRRRS
jgi:hypothetical protein